MQNIAKRAYTPEQKKEIINRLLVVWISLPDLRLGQLIANANLTKNEDKDIFYIEDFELIEKMESFLTDVM